MGVMQDLNYITQIMHHPCASPGMDVFITTGLEAAVTAIVTFHTFDCQDLMVEKLKEIEGPLTRPRHRKVKLGNIEKWGPSARNGNQWLYKGIILPARTLGAGFFVFGLGIHFYATWASMMYASAGCDQPNFVYRNVPFSVPFVITGDTPQALLLSGEVGHGCIQIGFSEVEISAGCVGTVTYEATWEQADPIVHPNASVECWLQTVGGRRSASTFWPNQNDPKATGTLGGLNTIKGADTGETAQVVAISHNGPMRCTGGSVSVSASGLSAPPLPKAGCPTANRSDLGAPF